MAQIEFKDEVTKPTAKVLNWGVVELQVQNQPAPAAYSMAVTNKAGSGQAGDQMKIVVAGQDGYIYSPEGKKWLKAPMQGTGELGSVSTQILDPDTLARAVPADLFSEGNLVNRHERVDGVDTTHYKSTAATTEQLINQQDKGQEKLLSGQAEFWVANSTGYLKQYSLDATTQDETGRELRHTARLLISNENMPVAIETPTADQIMSVPLFDVTPVPTTVVTATTRGGSEEAQAVLSALPAPPQSSLVSKDNASPEVLALMQSYGTGESARLVYVSTASMENLAAFYKEQLLGLGWSEVMSQAAKSPGQPTLGMYGKDNLSLMLIITAASENGKNIVLLQTGG